MLLPTLPRKIVAHRRARRDIVSITVVSTPLGACRDGGFAGSCKTASSLLPGGGRALACIGMRTTITRVVAGTVARASSEQISLVV